MNRVNTPSSTSQGFTLVELVLALSFISILLLTIAMTVIQMGATFNKGMALKEVNQTARDIDADFRRTFAAAEPIDLTPGAGQYAVTDAGGRLCLGTFSYIWNTEKALTEDSPELVKYSPTSPDPTKKQSVKLRFVKVPDSSKKYCAVTPTNTVATREIDAADIKLTTELVEAGDRQLGIEGFSISTRDTARDAATKQQLYTANYVLGSGNVSAMNDTQTACLETGNDADPLYCHVDQFSLVIRTGVGG
jgi:type II secretory pathway pseudopilin PulG